MGFGPTVPDRDQALRAIGEIVSTLYPERATPSALAALKDVARALLAARAPLSFHTIDRFLGDPGWRAYLLTRAPDQAPAWERQAGLKIAPEALDPDFAWLLRDRLAAEAGGPADEDPRDGPGA